MCQFLDHHIPIEKTDEHNHDQDYYLLMVKQYPLLEECEKSHQNGKQVADTSKKHISDFCEAELLFNMFMVEYDKKHCNSLCKDEKNNVAIKDRNRKCVWLYNLNLNKQVKSTDP